MIAKATEIIPANHKKLQNQVFSNNFLATYTIATGPDKEFKA
jgi:hypothetical protein